MTDYTAVYLPHAVREKVRELASLERRTMAESLTIAIEERLKAIAARRARSSTASKAEAMS